MNSNQSNNTTISTEDHAAMQLRYDSRCAELKGQIEFLELGGCNPLSMSRCMSKNNEMAALKDWSWYYNVATLGNQRWLHRIIGSSNLTIGTTMGAVSQSCN